MLHKVKVNKAELLAKVTTNRAKHIQEYEEAVVIFQEDLVKELSRKLRKAKAGIETSLYINLSTPEKHLKDYDMAIEQLRMSVEDEIDLDSSQFSTLVMDSWSWSSGFAANTQSYVQKAKR